jgi:hypothetical protein
VGTEAAKPRMRDLLGGGPQREVDEIRDDARANRRNAGPSCRMIDTGRRGSHRDRQRHPTPRQLGTPAPHEREDGAHEGCRLHDAGGDETEAEREHTICERQSTDARRRSE